MGHTHVTTVETFDAELLKPQITRECLNVSWGGFLVSWLPFGEEGKSWNDTRNEGRHDFAGSSVNHHWNDGWEDLSVFGMACMNPEC